MHRNVAQDLASIVDAVDVCSASNDLVEIWLGEDVGVEAVDPVLQFMEDHATVNFGAPGPLVHFVERFHRHGYEERLLRSVARKPTRTTVWMVNRLLNGTKSEPTRRQLIDVLRSVHVHARADQGAIDMARRFLERFGAA
jgi:hypothetical protein